MPPLPARPSSLRRRLTRAALLAIPILLALSGGPLPSRAAPPTDQGPFAPPPSPREILAELAQAPPSAKLQPSLARHSRGMAADERTWVVVRSARPVDLRAFDPHAHAFAWPAGEHLTVLRARAVDLPRIAALPEVAGLESGEPFGLDQPAAVADVPFVAGTTDLGRPDSHPISQPAGQADGLGAELAAVDGVKAATLSSGVASGSTGPSSAPAPDGLDAWFDTGPGHGTRDAWEQGFRGEGVTVAVLDSGVDFGHPDMHGTWKVLPEGHPYEGWPQALDPGGSYFYMLDTRPGSGTNLTQTANGGIVQTYQVSNVVERDVEGTQRLTACFRPLRSNRQLAEEDCDHILAESKSGRVRYGHHPDVAFNALRGEFMGVLLADPNRAGDYDTVYVDLDGDHDFSDEKPVSKASPLAWRDLDGDDVADLSGGLLTFIADGELPLPGAYLWGIEDEAPPAGTLVAFFYDTGNHGTLCASNIVSQGRLGVPPEVNLRFEDLPEGQPAATNPGAAPEAKLVGIIAFSGPTQLVLDAAWRYVVLGHDPNRDDDAIQISSNSYVLSGVEDSGWNSQFSRPIDHYNHTYSPTTIWTGGTGNGGPGYGTTMVPVPAASLKIGGTTQTGSTGADSIRRSDQITFGDIVPFSNRGPTSDGKIGPDIAADGASAAGAVPVNLVTRNNSAPETQRNGRYANVTWGGTSRSGPVQAGNLALVYQAFRQAQGRWPYWYEAQSILMGGARFNGYDAFATGAGTLDAGDATRIASGAHGIHALPPKWTAGDYRGQVHPAFPSIVRAGDLASGGIRLLNPSDQAIEVQLAGQTLRRIGSIEGVIPTDSGTISWPATQLAPDYLVALDRAAIPAGTELMAIRAIHPLAEADPDLNMVLDRSFSLAAYQHTDLDGDGRLWEDRDGNGAVNHAFLSGVTQGLDRVPALDPAGTEIDAGEYARFASSNQHMTNLQVWVHHPLERWKDGIHVGLLNTEVCLSADNCVGRRPAEPRMDIRYRVDFYRWEDWPWLELGAETLTIPARGERELPVTLSVPTEALPGAYQGAIFADYARGAGDLPVAAGGGWELPDRRLVIPVNANLARDYDWQGAVTLGGPAADDRDAPYNNGAVYGGQSWLWRAESGDWRHFLFEMAEPPAGTHLVTRTTWEDPAPGQADIDTRLWGPLPDAYSQANPDWFGPHSMAKIGQSPFLHLGRGNYAFHSSSGGNEDWVLAPAGAGLHEVSLHNVRSSGLQFEMPFTTTLAALRVDPSPIALSGNACRDLSLSSGLALEGLTVQAAGLGRPEQFRALPITQTQAINMGHRQDLRLESPAPFMEVAIRGRVGDDLDLYVLLDANADGSFDPQTEMLASSTSPLQDETITLQTQLPAGDYQIWVHGSSVVGGTGSFDMDLRAISGDQVFVRGAPDRIPAGATARFEVCVRGVDLATAPERMEGILSLGPAAAPGMLVLPIDWARAPEAPAGLYLPALLRGFEWER